MRYWNEHPEECERIAKEGGNHHDAWIAKHEPYDDGEECQHKYAEGLSGVHCVICGHFVGNWE